MREWISQSAPVQVLAEYIVVLAQMNKGRCASHDIRVVPAYVLAGCCVGTGPEHLSGELEAFFSDKA